MLTDIQRAELENNGLASIRLKLAAYSGGHTGPGSAIGGFRCGDITRSDIDDWLIEKTAEETKQQRDTLFWARVAGWGTIISIIVALAAIAVGSWLHDWLANRF